MRYILITVFAAMLFAGCVSVDNNDANYETAAICDNASIGSQLEEYKSKTKRVRGALAVGTPKGGGAIGGEKTNYDTERNYIVRDKLNRFEAEVDASYRNVTSSCKAYARCMQQNGHEEFKCQQSMNRWDSAEREFSGLTVKLREIEADVRKTAIKSKRCRGRHCRKKCHGDHCRQPCHGDHCCDGRDCHRPRPPRDCCDTLNNIFTDCCDRRR